MAKLKQSFSGSTLFAFWAGQGYNTQTSHCSDTVSLLFQGPGPKGEKHSSGAGKGLVTMVDL